MSIESTPSFGVQSDGASSGSSNTTPTPGASRPAPAIATEPRMPRSIRCRSAKRTSASYVAIPARVSLSRSRGTSPGSPTSTFTTGRPVSVTSSVAVWRTAPFARAASASDAST